MLRLKDRSKELLGSMLLAVVGVVVACGGGGSGSGEAGNRAVLKIVNATQQINDLSGYIDEELLFPQVLRGQASDFESVQDGTRLIELADNQNSDLKVQIQNEFAFSIPYTLVLTGPDNGLATVLAINDRSDTPQTQFRIRAINASSKSNLSVKLVPQLSAQRAVVLRAEATATVSPTMTALPAPTATASVIASPTATAAASPTSSNINMTEVEIVSGFNSLAVSDYVLVNRGDYQIQILRDGNTIASSGAVSYQAGQAESIVISENGGRLEIIRLNDKP